MFIDVRDVLRPTIAKGKSYGGGQPYPVWEGVKFPSFNE